MSTSPLPNDQPPRDAAYWATQVSKLSVTGMPSGALNINVEGREALSPLQGFGQMWQKTYRITLKGCTSTPAEVIKTWKEHFTEFWPKGNRFQAPLTGLAPGEVALITMAMPGGILSTGVVVLYADDESFTVMTPQGHVFAGWNTFSAYEVDGYTVVQIVALIRASDPIYEIGFRLGASKTEDKFWQHTLRAVAAHFDVEGLVETEVICIDPRLQWSEAKNIWQNAFIRTTIYRVTTPLRLLYKWSRARTQRTR